MSFCCKLRLKRLQSYSDIRQIFCSPAKWRMVVIPEKDTAALRSSSSSAEREHRKWFKPMWLGTLFWHPACVIFRCVQVFRNSRIFHRQPETESFARPDISTKVSNIILSQLSKITRWKNNRMCGASVKCRLANACAIFSRSIEQHAQRRNLNMGLVAKRNNPERQCWKPIRPLKMMQKRVKRCAIGLWSSYWLGRSYFIPVHMTPRNGYR